MRKILRTIRKPKPPKELSDDEKMLIIVRNVWEHYKSISRIEKNLSLCRVSFNQTHGRLFKGGDVGNNLDILWQQVTGQKIVRYKQNEE